MDEDDAKDYTALADWLERKYPGLYGSGALYLRQLAGVQALPQETLPQLSWMSPSLAQNAAAPRIVLPDPLESDAHNLQVTFHRL